jgi:hypothetical protein
MPITPRSKANQLQFIAVVVVVVVVAVGQDNPLCM